jgi:uncharacterized protein
MTLGKLDKRVKLKMKYLFALLVFIAPAFAEPLTITTVEGKTHVFDVEKAVTPDQRARGLMFRPVLEADKGMIFDFGPGEAEAAMWMKNTLIPLDMLFIREDGTIRTIAVNTVPFSTETVSSKGGVRSVLELQGGITLKLNIKAGDKIEFKW